MPEWFVYVLKSVKKDWIYDGSTNDIPRRFEEHQQGLIQSTKSSRPLELVAYIAVTTGAKARELLARQF